ncbi:MAG: FKBP-type peptidyl-prolyl cis-trans isomerase [Steroidobacteraceae bacterium]
MRNRVFPIILACALLASCSKVAQNTASEPQTEDEKTLYALGVLMSGNLQSFSLTEAEVKQVQQGLADGALGKKQPADVESFVPKLQELQKTRETALAGKEKEAGKAYLTKAAAEKDATTTTSGIVMKTLKAGTGASPGAADTVKVHYEGRFVDGKVFDSSIKSGEPVEFPLSGVIPCWTEAVQTMKVGGKAQIVCPSDLAYGDEGRPPQMRGGATLVFDIELLEVSKGQSAPAGGKPAERP